MLTTEFNISSPLKNLIDHMKKQTELKILLRKDVSLASVLTKIQLVLLLGSAFFLSLEALGDWQLEANVHSVLRSGVPLLPVVWLPLNISCGRLGLVQDHLLLWGFSTVLTQVPSGYPFSSGHFLCTLLQPGLQAACSILFLSFFYVFLTSTSGVEVSGQWQEAGKKVEKRCET